MFNVFDQPRWDEVNQMESWFNDESGTARRQFELSPQGLELKRLLDESIARSQEYPPHIETRIEQKTIESSIGPFDRMTDPEHVVKYPPTVVQVLGELYMEYNGAFKKLIEANREWDTDYQYMLDPDGNPLNFFVQIDMVALPQDFLEQAANCQVEDIKEILRGRIFEIENSLAMYQLLMKIFKTDEGTPTRFEKEFRAGLDNVREVTGKKIAIVTVTDEKYESVMASEFGKNSGSQMDEEETRRLSGFDRVFSPQDLEEYMQQHPDESEYVFYVRSSHPTKNLKDPMAEKPITILDDDETRRYIKAHAITPNIDSPEQTTEKINDTKEYMPEIGLAEKIHSSSEYQSFYSEKFQLSYVFSFLHSLNISHKQLSQKFIQELWKEHNINPKKLHSGDLSAESATSLWGTIKDTSLTELFNAQALKIFERVGILPEQTLSEALGFELMISQKTDIAGKARNAARKAIKYTPADELLSNELKDQLTRTGVKPESVAAGGVGIRLKPMKGAYGAYGHHTMQLNGIEGITKLLKDIKARDGYVWQPEMVNPRVIFNQKEYIQIDRNFYTINDAGQPVLMGGFRSLMPTDTVEAKNNRVHGNGSTLWREVAPQQE